MQIKESENCGVVVLSVEGDIDLNSSPIMRDKFNELAQKETSKILLNFSSVNYIDSSGLATLIEMLQRLKKYQGQLRLANVSEKIRSLFEVTKLDKLFKMYASEDDAIKDF